MVTSPEEQAVDTEGTVPAGAAEDEGLAVTGKPVTRKKAVYIASVTALILCGSLAAATIFIQKPTPIQERIEEPIITKDFENDLPPPGFMPEIHREGVQSPVHPPVQPGADELFKKVEPVVDPLEVKRQEEVNNFLAARDASTHASAAGFVVTYPTKSGANYAIENIDQYRNMDKDYSAQKIPATITSKPVDLSRTLPMTETIPVILIDEIKSELAGEVVRATIPQDVYSYHGRHILIPAGSTAIGRYKPLQKIGDSRLAIAFYRVVTPEGINIKLSGFAADQEGSEGLTGEIDNKAKEKFGGAGIAALLQAMAQLSINVNSDQQKAAANSITQPLNEVMTQVISQSINIAPTLRIPKGSTFNIKFASDIWFPEPVTSVIDTVAL